MKKLMAFAWLFLSVISAPAQAKECAAAVKPVCKADERALPAIEHGCNVLTCEKVDANPPSDEFQPEGCPSLVIPVCKDGEEKNSYTDPNRCPYILCEPKDKSKE